MGAQNPRLRSQYLGASSVQFLHISGAGGGFCMCAWVESVRKGGIAKGTWRKALESISGYSKLRPGSFRPQEHDDIVRFSLRSAVHTQ